MIRDLNEKKPVIRDRDPPFTTLSQGRASCLLMLRVPTASDTATEKIL